MDRNPNLIIFLRPEIVLHVEDAVLRSDVIECSAIFELDGSPVLCIVNVLRCISDDYGFPMGKACEPR